MDEPSADVKFGYVYSKTAVDALVRSLSATRLETYRRKTDGDKAAAIRLHAYNTAVCAAFYGPLQILEIALRNAIHRELSEEYGAEWYDSSGVGLDVGALAKVSSARKALKRGGYPDDPPYVVATLSFGFWVALLGSGGRLPGDRKANYEMTIWRAAAHRSFPNSRLNRKSTHAPFDYLRTLRNRIAHHEPIFDRHLAADYQSVITTAGWICNETREWIVRHNRISGLLAMSSDDRKVEF